MKKNQWPGYCWFFPWYLYTPCRPLPEHLKVDVFPDIFTLKSKDLKTTQPHCRSTFLRDMFAWSNLVQGEEHIFQTKISSRMSFATALRTGLTLFCWRLSQSKSCSIRSIALTMRKQGRLRSGTSSGARAMAGKGRTHDNLSGSTTATAGNKCQSWKENTDFLISISITMKNDLKLPIQQPAHYVII